MEKEYSSLNKVEKQLIEEMEQVVTMDCHEHLVPEEKRLKAKVDVMLIKISLHLSHI